jgi:hypothetical protein
VSGPYAGFFHQGAVGQYAEKVPNIQRIINMTFVNIIFSGGKLSLPPPCCMCMALVLCLEYRVSVSKIVALLRFVTLRPAK